MNYLIGGNGYIGNVVNNYFKRQGLDTCVIDSNLYNLDYLDNDYPEIDLRNFDKLDKLNFNNSNIILLAGLVGDPITKKYPELSSEININSTKKLIKYIKAKNINKFIFISTCSNYGLQKNDDLVDEETELDPKSLYAKAKVEIEKYIFETNLDYTVLRFATAFGHSQRMRFDLTLNEFTAKLFLDYNLEIYDSETWRPYCHVVDFARAIFNVIYENPKNSSKQVFNIGSNENNITKKDLVKKIHKKVNKGRYSFIEKSIDPRNYKVNFNKSERELGFKTAFNIDYGINEIVENLKQEAYSLSELEDSFLNYGNFKIDSDKHLNYLNN